MIMKPSKFLITTRNIDGELIVLNTLTGKLLKFNTKDSDVVESVLAGQESHSDLLRKLFPTSAVIREISE